MGDIDYSLMVDSGFPQLLQFAQSVEPDAIEVLANHWKQLSEDIPRRIKTLKTS